MGRRYHVVCALHQERVGVREGAPGVAGQADGLAGGQVARGVGRVEERLAGLLVDEVLGELLVGGVGGSVPRQSPGLLTGARTR